MKGIRARAPHGRCDGDHRIDPGDSLWQPARRVVAVVERSAGSSHKKETGPWVYPPVVVGV
jgi:hypothetical protein